MKNFMPDKNRLKMFCMSQLEQRIDRAKLLLQEAQESANSEEKSSAGDKYETGRAMGHLQKEMLSGQLAACIADKKLLEQVDCKASYAQVSPGALVVTDRDIFFLAAGIGRQEMEGEIILVISPLAPLAKGMMGKRPGECFAFNGQTQIIRQIS